MASVGPLRASRSPAFAAGRLALAALLALTTLAGCACPGACGFDRSDSRRSLRYAADAVSGHFCRDRAASVAIVTGIPDAFGRETHAARQGLCTARALNAGCGTDVR
jgi:hypothetical protein